MNDSDSDNNSCPVAVFKFREERPSMLETRPSKTRVASSHDGIFVPGDK